MGWIGSTRAVENYLAVVGADRDGEGNFIISGDKPPVSFMGEGSELVIDDSVVYFKDKQPVKLVANMVSTIGQGQGRGLCVVVI